MKRFVALCLVLACISAIAGCSDGSSPDGDDDDDGGTPTCEQNLTATFTMRGGGNTAWRLYVDGDDRGIIEPGDSITTIVDATQVVNVSGTISEGPLTGSSTCGNNYAMDICEELEITCGPTVTFN